MQMHSATPNGRIAILTFLLGTSTDVGGEVTPKEEIASVASAKVEERVVLAATILIDASSDMRGTSIAS